MSYVLKTEQVVKKYRIGREVVTALDGITLAVSPGEFCCIIGPSGSGKSTLLTMMAGLEKPTSGCIYACRHNITKMDENQLASFRNRRIGFIFQSYNLLPQLTALENVALPLLFSGENKYSRNKRALQLLKQFGLYPWCNHKPLEMSGGQQQRVGIARAFITKPQLVFADEPTGNLDSAMTKVVLRMMLHEAQASQAAIIMVTHEEELAKCADRIITLRDGTIVSDVYQPEKMVTINRSKWLS